MAIVTGLSSYPVEACFWCAELPTLLICAFVRLTKLPVQVLVAAAGGTVGADETGAL